MSSNVSDEILTTEFLSKDDPYIFDMADVSQNNDLDIYSEENIPVFTLLPNENINDPTYSEYKYGNLNGDYLILIDLNTPDKDFIVNKLLSNVTYLYINSSIQSFSEIFSNIKKLNLGLLINIGIVRENNGHFFGLPINSINNITDDFSQFNEFKLFLNNLKENFGMDHFDLITCNCYDQHWQTIIQKFKNEYGLHIRSSINVTGYGGDWILESDNIDLVNLYFTEDIMNYRYALLNLNQTINDISLAVWLKNDPSTMVLDANNKVSTWYDQSGRGRNATKSDANKRPIYDATLGSLFFNGINGELDIDLNSAIETSATGCKDHIAYFVIKRTKTGSALYGSRSTENFGITAEQLPYVGFTNLLSGDIGKIDKYNIKLLSTGVTFDVTPNFKDDHFNVVAYNWLETTKSVYTNNILEGTSNANFKLNSFGAGSIIGGNIYGYGGYKFIEQVQEGYFTGYISEIIFLAGSNITPTNNQIITNYLMEKYTSNIQLEGTGRHTMLIDNFKNIWGTGYNEHGSLGISNNINTNVLSQLTNSTGKTIKQISHGKSHTVVLMTDGTVYSCGLNSFGQRGTENTKKSNTLGLINLDYKKIAHNIYCGENHTVALMTDGSLYSCGLNSSGQLGIGNTTNMNTLTLISLPLGKNIKQVRCGGYHTVVLMTDGSVYSCGLNVNGQLGIGNNTNQTSLAAMILPSDKTVKEIACGGYHTILLMTDGTVYVCGQNTNGQLGTGNLIEQNIPVIINLPDGKIVKQISCGGYHTMILMTDATLYGCGLNSDGQLGTGNNSDNISTLTLTSYPSDKIIQKISCSWINTHMLMIDGTIYGAGSNEWGQLGTGNNTSSNIFVSMKRLENGLLSDVSNISSLSSTYNFETYDSIQQNTILVPSTTVLDNFCNVIFNSNLFSTNSLILNNQSADYRNGEYFITASSTIKQGNDTRFDPFRVFNRNFSGDRYFTAWYGAGSYSKTTGNYQEINDAKFTRNISGSVDISGDWIQLELPYRIILNKIEIMPTQENSQGPYGYHFSKAPRSFVIVGSNDNYNWNIIYSGTTEAYQNTRGAIRTINFTSNNQTPYSYLRLIVRQISPEQGANWGGIVSLQQLNYYGIAYPPLPKVKYLTSSILPQDGGKTISIIGNHLTNITDVKLSNISIPFNIVSGKQIDIVAPPGSVGNKQLSIIDNENFTVNKTLEYVDLETPIAINSNVIHRPQIFFNETAPQPGAPPNNFNIGVLSDETETFRNGTYTVWSSGENSNGAQYSGYNAFNQNNTVSIGENFWASDATGLYWSYNMFSDGQFTGGTGQDWRTRNIEGSSDIYGVWLDILVPYKIMVQSISLTPRRSSFPNQINHMPVSMAVVGSNDRTNWKLIYSQTQLSTPYDTTIWQPKTFFVNNETEPCSYLRLITRSVGQGGVSLMLQQINYNGYIYSPFYETPTITNTEGTGRHTMLIDLDKNLWGTGYNEYGSLGNNTIIDQNSFSKMNNITNKIIKNVIYGKAHTIVLMEDKTIYSCGLNSYGQLGLGDNFRKLTLNLITFSFGIFGVNSIACGEHHTVALLTDGSLCGWGLNTSGQLGINNTINRSTATIIPLPSGKSVKQFSCGGYHTVILMTDGTVYSCGLNSNGQLGNGTTNNSLSLSIVNLPQGKNVKEVICGGYHTIVLMTDNTLYGCGLNSSGQLGINNTINQHNLIIIDSLPFGSSIKQVSCGGYHTLIIMNNNNIYCCGLNNDGQLGLNDNTNRLTFTQISSLYDKSPNIISACWTNSYVLMSDGTAYGCGSNTWGQLGSGDNIGSNSLISMKTLVSGNLTNITNVGSLGLGYISQSEMVTPVPQTINEINMALWLKNDPSTMVIDSNLGISLWYDQSGKGNNAIQNVATKRPIYDGTLNSVYFDMASGVTLDEFDISLNFLVGTTHIAYFVMKSLTYPGLSLFWGAKSGGQDEKSLHMGFDNTGTAYSFNNWGTPKVNINANTNTNLLLRDFNLIAYNWLENTRSVYTNNILEGTTNSTAKIMGIASGGMIGGNITGLNRYWNGYISEIIFLTGSNITPTNNEIITNYLMTKYSLYKPDIFSVGRKLDTQNVKMIFDIKGKNITTDSILKINNTTISYTYISANQIILELPFNESYPQTIQLTIQNSIGISLPFNVNNKLLEIESSLDNMYWRQLTTDNEFIFQMSLDNSNWIDIRYFNFPIILKYTGSNRLNLYLTTDMQLNKATDFRIGAGTDNYFIIGSDNITIDGSYNGIISKISLNTITNYLGLFQNGTSQIPGKSNITIKNLSMVRLNDVSTLVSGAGWFCQEYFGNGSTNIIISNLNSTENINSTLSGGIVGRNFCTRSYGNNIIMGCYSTGSINGQYSGGVIGSYMGAYGGNVTVTNCYSSGTINNNDVGGVIGSFMGDAGGNIIVTNCYSTGIIAGVYAGGICGSFVFGNSIVKNCYSTGNINSNNSGGICGPFAGSYFSKLRVTDCYSTGIINNNYAGGICGSHAGHTNGNVEIINCYSTASQINGQGSGGIVGSEAGHTNGIVSISRCYSTGTINGRACGGIAGIWVGFNTNEWIKITGCYSRGGVTGRDAGGIIGGEVGYMSSKYFPKILIENCYSIGEIPNIGFYNNGTICGGSIGNAGPGFVYNDNKATIVVIIKNCYTLNSPQSATGLSPIPINYINSLASSSTISGGVWRDSSASLTLSNFNTYWASNSPNTPYVFSNKPFTTSLDVSSGPISGGTTVTLSGYNFDNNSVLKIDNVIVPFTLISSTYLTFITPVSNNIGPVNVTITKGSEISNPQVFTYLTPGPIITSIDPSFGTIIGGTSVTINGSNFNYIANIKINNVSIPFTLISQTQLTIITPPNPAGLVQINVTDMNGTINSISFNYVDPGFSISYHRQNGVSLQTLKKIFPKTKFLQEGYSEFYYLLEKDLPLSPICFFKDTPVVTDQGIIEIQNIVPGIHTIRNKAIKAVTKTRTLENNLVLIKKDSLGTNIPSKDTIISQNHKIIINKTSPVKAKKLLKHVKNGVELIKYNGEVLYNVLLDTHNVMIINNLVVETLDPKNIIAKIYNLEENERIELINELNELIINNDNEGYTKLCKKL